MLGVGTIWLAVRLVQSFGVLLELGIDLLDAPIAAKTKQAVALHMVDGILAEGAAGYQAPVRRVVGLLLLDDPG